MSNTEKAHVGVLVGDGIGNMIMATPLISALYKSGYAVHVLAFPRKQGDEEFIYNPNYLDTVDFVCLRENTFKVKGYKSFTEYNLKYIVETFHFKYQYLTKALSVPKAKIIRFPYDVYGKDMKQVYALNEYEMNLKQGLRIPDVNLKLGKSFVAEPVEKKGLSHYDFTIHMGTIEKGHRYWAHRNWNKYDELVKILIQREPNCKIAIIGTNEDTFSFNYNQLRAENPENIDILVGKLNKFELLQLFKNTKIFIGNDGGCMHMASAMGTPTVGLFGVSIPKKNLPLSTPVVGIVSDRPCVGCVADRAALKRCNHNICMEDITTGHVIKAIDTVRNKRIREIIYTSLTVKQDIIVSPRVETTKIVESRVGDTVGTSIKQRLGPDDIKSGDVIIIKPKI